MRLNGFGITALVGIMLLTACGGGDSKPTPTTGTLGLTLEVSPLVAGFNPSVEVRRGNTAVWTITSLGRSERKLEAGTYTIATGSPPTNYRAALTVGTDGVPNSQVELKAGQTLEARLSFAQGFGSLRVNITPPSGVSGFVPSVVVKNASNAVIATLTQTDTIDNLPQGSYSVEPATVTAQGVPWAGNASGSPANVTLSTTPEVNVGYAATRSVVTVNLSGLGANDAASVTLSRSDGTGTPVTQNRTGNGAVVFADLAFGNYLVRASSTRSGTYIDSAVGFNGSISTASTDLSTIFRSLEAPMTARPQTGRLFVAGNGSMSNTGWTVGRQNTRSSTATPPLATPEPNPCLTTNGVGTCPVVGTNTSVDSGFSLSDSEVPTSSSNLPTASSITDAGELNPAGLYRIEFDPSGNLYAIYQFTLTYPSTLPAPPSAFPLTPQSSNRIVRVTRENLEATPPVLAEGGSNRVMFNDSIGNRAGGSNVTDIAFDLQGNLWMANQAGDAVSCISAAQLNGSGAFSSPNKVIVGSTAVTPYHLQNPRALVFDAQGDLWIAGGRHAPQLTSGGTNLEPYLARISDDATLACTGGRVTVTPDIYLNISLTTSTNGAFFQPWGMAIQTVGAQQNLWISDYGGGADFYNSTAVTPATTPPTFQRCPGDGVNAASNNGSMDGNIIRESVIKVPLTGGNLTVGSSLRPANVTSRLTVGAADDPATTTVDRDRGMQQATHLAFDSRGNLWVATNNHTEFDPANPCFANSGFTADPFSSGPMSRLRTDRRGKLYVIGASELGDRASATSLAPVSPLLTLSAPSAGVGFTGVAFR